MLTEEIIEENTVWKCDFCGSKHKGHTNFSKKRTVDIMGNFCCQECYDQWRAWKDENNKMSESTDILRKIPNIKHKIFLNCDRCGTQYSIAIPYREANHPARNLCDNCISDLSEQDFRDETWKQPEPLSIIKSNLISWSEMIRGDP
jgi:hypothetical protein